MFKKIIIPSAAFFLMSAMAFYTAKMEGPLHEPQDTVETTAYEPIVVLELFTSQGCSSCPPADELLDRVKKQYPKEVFALSYHVDYWNYIGWEDPFSKSAFTKKQRDYNVKFQSRSNYTPQLVVNGLEHMVGSHTAKVYSKIDGYKKQSPQNQISIANLDVQNKDLEFEYDVEGDLKGKQLRAVLVLDERTTSVKRGENRNRTLTNTNIVVAEKYLPELQSNGKSNIEIPAIIGNNESFTLILIVESENLDITAAAKSKVLG
ncbi:DUF1223 domain-containing protein [Flagellimonas allohymeniacidonis]|uniref:DUF1223 domain-containing protein n=1 Tax=Flagellimonas allohymeniacidonis TaxID=2517819 RepID=A0A4Q8QJX5_9FLAO|nr:DUF1223 domain-containing protein [Allomuricauda hymeniacidonis]TAI48536.1 DUF1223 domain-containing protein [Allomuricauda hymeniacidonis]